jgi:hypothetical protein
MRTEKYRAKMGGEIVDAEVPLNESVVTFYRAPAVEGDEPEKNQLMHATFIALYEKGATPVAPTLPQLPPTVVTGIPQVRTSGPIAGSPIQIPSEAPEWLEELLSAQTTQLERIADALDRAIPIMKPAIPLGPATGK